MAEFVWTCLQLGMVAVGCHGIAMAMLLVDPLELTVSYSRGNGIARQCGDLIGFMVTVNLEWTFGIAHIHACTHTHIHTHTCKHTHTHT